MTTTIEMIQEAEKASDTLLRKHKAMERDFKKDDGVIDKKEQAQLDAIDTKIAQVKTKVAQLRKDLEEAKKAWDKRFSEYSKLKSELEELQDWGHKDAGKVAAALKLIDACPPAQRWKDAVAELDKAIKLAAPIYKEFETQSKAKDEYTPKRAEFDSRLAQAKQADPPMPAIMKAVTSLEGNVGAIDTNVKALNYVEALDLVKIGLGELDRIEEGIRLAKDQKGMFELQAAELKRQLDEVRACQFPPLAGEYDELMKLGGEVDAAGTAYDYVKGFKLIEDGTAKATAYMKKYAELVTPKDQYEARLSVLQPELDKLTCEYDELQPQNLEIANTDKEMKAAASADDYKKALELMDKLRTLLDAYYAAEKIAKLHAEYDAVKAETDKNTAGMFVTNYGPLVTLTEEVYNDVTKADNMAAKRDYTAGIRLLKGVAPKIERYQKALAEQQKAEKDYLAKRDVVLDEWKAIGKDYIYPPVADLQLRSDAVREKMMALESTRDYVGALRALTQLEPELAAITALVKQIQEARAAYETRQPPLIKRFDKTNGADYAPLAEKLLQLPPMRREMEDAAKALDYPTALAKLEALERKLNELDAEIEKIEHQKAQYEEVLAKIKDGLAKVEACKHEELKDKKAEILKARDEMLAAANKDDYATALEKANGLIKPLGEFAQLEIDLAKYLEGLEKLKPELEKVRAFTFKSLAKDKEKAEKLFKEMEADAKAVKFSDALKKQAELMKVLAQIVERNETLKQKKAVYEQLKSDMAGKVEAVKKNAVEAAKDEFEKAVEKAEAVNAAIEAYLAKVEKEADAKAAYLQMKELAEAGYAKAEEKSKSYKDLEKPFEGLKEIHDKMLAAEKSEPPKWDEAKAKAKELLDATGKFEEKAAELRDREVKLKTKADGLKARFKALPEDAKKKDEDDYEDAQKYLERTEEGLKEKDLDRAEENIGKLEEALGKLDEALKSDEQVKAEYEERLKGLDRDKEKAEKSPFAEKKLKDELKAVHDAYDKMAEAAKDGDYRKAKDLSDAVQQALDAFFKAEVPLQMDKVRFDERKSGLQKDYERVTKAADEDDAPIPLKALGPAMKALWGKAEEQERALDYAEGLKTLEQLRKLVDSGLDVIQATEEAKKKAEKEKSTVDKLIEDAKNLVVDEVLDRLEKVPVIGEAVETGRDIYHGAESAYDGLLNIKDAAGHAWDGDWDAAGEDMKKAGGHMWDAGKAGLKTAAKFNPEYQAYKRAMDLAEEAKDAYEKIQDLMGGD